MVDAPYKNCAGIVKSPHLFANVANVANVIPTHIFANAANVMPPLQMLCLHTYLQI